MNLPIIPRWLPSLACLLLGLLIGWWLWHPKAAPVESAAPAIILKGGGQVLQRQPSAPVPQIIKQAVQQLPGAKLERAAVISVKPKLAPATAATSPGTISTSTCAPMDVDLGYVSMPDGTHRIIATSSDGTITGGMDIPTQPTMLPASTKWAAGALYDAVDKRYGGFIDRDVGPFRVGLEVLQPIAGQHSFTAVARIGIRF